MNDKVVVYAGTKNVYPQMYTSLKSLLLNNQIDRVYLLIEDDEFPYPIPENVHPFNVTEQEFFPAGSANFQNPWSYMTMLRCVLGLLLPDETEVLWLDIDTIIDDDITDLFSLNMNGYYYAGVMEPGKSKDVFRYINAGVLLCNLDFLRPMHKEQEMMAFLNSYKLRFLDQDIINLLCQGRIRLIDSEYNSNDFVMPCTRPRIIHYAAKKDYLEDSLYKKYEQMELPLEVKNDGES